MADANRPKLLGFMTWLMLISGVVQAIAGALIIIDKNDAKILDALEATSSEATSIGIAMIIAGVIAVFVASSLRTAANWARLLVGTVALLHLVGLVWAAIAYHSLHWYNVAWPALVYGLIAGYMFSDDDVKEYFGQ